MRQASWNEVFAPRQHEPLVVTPDVPREPEGWRRLFWWEDVLTFSLLGVMLLAVVAAVQQARWVDGMPSLYPIAFFGLFMGALLARVRWHEGFIHLLALPIGAAGSLAAVLSVLPGSTPWDRYDVLHERMAQWFHIAFFGGISNDNLPVIVLMVPLTWLGAYLSAWAVFRWQNAWMAAIPGGVALLLNVSVIDGQSGFAFAVYVLAAALLVTRMHLLERAKRWRHDGIPYPATISVSVLHATFWAALVLLAIAWTMPRADRTPALESLAESASRPIVDRTEGYGRLFLSVNHGESNQVHDFSDILPFLGSIDLPQGASFSVEAGPLDQDAYLRAQSYTIYTPSGWRTGRTQQASLPRDADTPVDESVTAREERTIRVFSSGRTGEAIITLGQPRSVSQPSVVERGGRTRADVTGIDATRRVPRGQAYESSGSVSVATEDDLRGAGESYPQWVRGRYLQIPDSLPDSVRRLADDVTQEAGTPYDAAVQVQDYLRAIPYDLDVPRPPAGHDPIEYFLFEAKRGYFDYHASAMVMMLRSQGIPARLAVGYVISPDERDPESGRIRVSEENAYAWPEVYFPGYGWLEFNPTPDHAAISRDPTLAAQADGTTREEGAPLDTLGLGAVDNGTGESSDPPLASQLSDGSADGTPWLLIGVLGGLTLAAVAGAGGLGFAWVRGLSGLDAPARLWGQTVRLAGWTRTPAAPGETPREFAARLRDEVGADGVDQLSDAYVRHRFGRQPIDEGDAARLESAWRSVRGKLLRRLLPFS